MSVNNTNALCDNHLTTPPPIVDKENKDIVFTSTDNNGLTKHEQCVFDIQTIFNKGYTPENGNTLINYIQKQRSLLIEIMLLNFMKKPNPKMADSMNTLLAQMEKSVRDDRKESIQLKEIETSRETFELFSQSLNAVIDGRIHIPTFEEKSLVLDPLNPLSLSEEFKFKPGEFIVGPQVIDIKPIEKKLNEINDTSNGEGELEKPVVSKNT